MKKLNAVGRIALGLVALAASMVLIFDLVFGLLPSDTDTRREIRQKVSEHLAIQTAGLLQARDLSAISTTLQTVFRREPDMRSIAVRRADGLVLASAGDHVRHWVAPRDGMSTLTHVVVPIQADGVRWGALEITFRSSLERPLIDWLTGPTVKLMGLQMLGGFVLFYLYMRRALQHLDPRAAVPERVRVAFDSLTEGVLIVDASARIVLTNHAFRRFGGERSRDPIGRRPDDIPWLSAALGPDVGEVPWLEAMRTGKPVSARPIAIGASGSQARKAVVNCAPVLDGAGGVQGCMITFNDVTQLEAAREQLVDALADLVTSKEELERKNEELEWLASRDPLTGCLNRRVFFERFEMLYRNATRDATALACVMCDIDKFKSINDRFGHQVGDQVIKEIGALLQRSARPGDLVGRYGGEEFCLVVAGLDAAGMARFAETLRARFEAECATSVPALFGSSVTASFGVSALDHGAHSPTELIDQADQALYAAKHGGRNRVTVFASPEDQEHLNEDATNVA
jgi:diguanylate cyclase (GGDEF)-like protein